MLSVAISFCYCYIFQKQFGSPKEKILQQQLDNLKLEYSLLGRQMNNTLATLTSLEQSDDKRYRPILEMETLPESYRKGAVGGIERFSDLKGFKNSDFLISYKTRMEEIKNRTNVQKESFEDLTQKSIEWRRQVDHFPGISPVSVKFRLGDGYRFRPVHPISGTPRMHNGQDFEVPYGTEVYATGDGVVVEAGRNNGGFGNLVVIDHDYGLSSLYGHLSQIRVVKGQNVKRGDLIGISGSTGASTGPHLHYEVEQMGHAINPNHYINIDRDLDEEEYNEMIQAFGSGSKYR
jgi:murein DD-endopeptidase MepM/ murein hydrolase activator NlpD